MARLDNELAIALGYTLEATSVAAYTSALHSYLDFCSNHRLPVEPTVKTLAYYAVYMCHFISPRSVQSYLSGIASQLEPFYPEARANRNSSLVKRAMAGSTKRRALPIVRKRAITYTELQEVHTVLSDSQQHDDRLFLALCHTSFHALLRLGESVWPDKRDFQDYRKVVMRDTVQSTEQSFAFSLPGHKADRMFEGSRVFISYAISNTTCRDAITNYLRARDKAFPFKPELWLRQDGSVPKRRWFMKMLRKHFPTDTSGHSFRPGGTTYLANLGVPSYIIQGIGRWKSEAYQSYIRTHPTVLAALLMSTPPPQPNS